MNKDICWKSSTKSCRQPRRLLECIQEKFLSQAIESPARGNVTLDLMVTNAGELTCSLGCSDPALVEVAATNFPASEANFQFLNYLVNRTNWETALRDKGAEQS